jgi:hypothetical protein
MLVGANLLMITYMNFGHRSHYERNEASPRLMLLCAWLMDPKFHLIILLVATNKPMTRAKIQSVLR